MGLTGWIRSHPVASSLIAFLLVAGLAAGGLTLYVLSDQRRAGQLLSYTLREALGVEIQIERVVKAGPDRLVLKGVSVPGALDLRIPEVRVEGPLLSLLIVFVNHIRPVKTVSIVCKDILDELQLLSS